VAGLAPIHPKAVTHKKKLPGKVLTGTSLVKEADLEVRHLVVVEADAQVLGAKAVRVAMVVVAVTAVIKTVAGEDAATPGERRRKKSWMPRWRTTSAEVAMLPPRLMAHLLLPLLRRLGLPKPPPGTTTSI